MDKARTKPYQTPPYDLHKPQGAADATGAAETAGLWIISSPHSGSVYPPDFIAASRLGAHDLRRSEDAHIDTLLADLPKQGAIILAARFARAYLDLNREPYELDPTMFRDKLPPHVNCNSPRARAGLGTIARLVTEQMPIYRDKLSFAEAEARIAAIYVPFHKQLKSLLDDACTTHGGAFLLDIHSMPSSMLASTHTSTQADSTQNILPDIILGDRHGVSCHPALTQSALTYLTDCGYRTICNKFYAGGYITAHYGQPSQHRHALQIEIARRLYMDEQTYRLHDGFARLKADFSGLLQHLRTQENIFLGDTNNILNPTQQAAE